MSHALRSSTLAVTLLLSAGAASGQDFTVSMTPDQVVPPTPSTATGQGALRLDTENMLAFDIGFAGLHGSETEASVHGPAPAGSNAEVLFRLPLGNTKTGRLGPLTPQQRADLTGGLWYVTIHSSHHGSGEIRGQIRMVVAVEARPWGSVKERYRGH